jgi:hypothetical protein
MEALNPGDIKIKKESRHSGQRFMLIRNPCCATAFWIPGQAGMTDFI